MANIRVTPEQLESQGRDLHGMADELNEIMHAVDAKINEIIAGWDGLAQDAYYDMYQQMRAMLVKFPELVDLISQATIASAQAFSQVDEELRNSFK